MNLTVSSSLIIMKYAKALSSFIDELAYQRKTKKFRKTGSLACRINLSRRSIRKTHCDSKLEKQISILVT